MTDGKHCPVCCEDVGYWSVALHVFWVRCPHCRTRLRYVQSGTTALANVFGALTLVTMSLVLGVVAGVVVLDNGGGLMEVLSVGAGVAFGLALLLGCGLQMVMAPTYRSKQTLTTWDKAEEIPEDFA